VCFPLPPEPVRFLLDGMAAGLPSFASSFGIWQPLPVVAQVERREARLCGIATLE
jgi:hypothetical protein